MSKPFKGKPRHNKNRAAKPIHKEASKQYFNCNEKKLKQSRDIPELALETTGERGTLELAEASGICSEGLPLCVKELMAHLHCNIMLSVSVFSFSRGKWSGTSLIDDTL